MKLIANRTLPLQAQAFLMALYVGESGGDYTILYGGGHFDVATPSREGYYGFPDWPGKDNSHAAGAPQFEPATWKGVCDSMRSLPRDPLDFRKPEDQDSGAWLLAQDDYHRRTGDSLLAMLRGGDVQGIAPALHETWTSLDETAFPARYARALAMIPVAAPFVGAPQPSPAPAASAAPQEGNPMNWLMARLNEPSTHAAAAAIAAAVAGATTGPVQQIALLVAALFGGAGIVKKAA